MGRKKRKLNLELKPFCYYCDREFSDEKVLLQHQKAKHFKCLICDRKLDLANSLAIHMMQVHKSNLKAVPNSLPKRSNPELNIRGMSGVPSELIEDNLNKLKQKINAINIKRQQSANNSLKKQRMEMIDASYFPYNSSAPNYYPSAPYAYQTQQNTNHIPDSFQKPSLLNTSNDGTQNASKNINKEIDVVNGGVAAKKQKHVVNGNTESENDQTDANEMDTSSEKHKFQLKQNKETLKENSTSKTITNEELAKSKEKMTLNLMDPLNIFEDLPFKLPMFSSNAKQYGSTEEKQKPIPYMPSYIPPNKIDIATKPQAKTTASRGAPPISTVLNKENPVANTIPNNISAPGIASVPPPPPCPRTSVASHGILFTSHNSSVHSSRHVPFIPPPPVSAPTTTHMQPPAPFMPTTYQVPTPPPPPSVPSVASLPTLHHSAVHSSKPHHLSSATATATAAATTLPIAISSTPAYFSSQPVAPGSSNSTSVPTSPELSTIPVSCSTSTCPTTLSSRSNEQNMFSAKTERSVPEECIFSHWCMSKEGSLKDSEWTKADITTNNKANNSNSNNKNTYLYNNSKAKIIQLNLPPATNTSLSPQEEELILFYKETDFVYRVKAIQEFGWIDEVS